MTVRQYKIHTNLDSQDNKIYDVTNGKLRFYAPTNLGIVIANNIWAVDGIGVKGGSNLSHPDIEFKMETFGDTLEENYRLVTEFIQDVLSNNFVTLEYTTDNFTVYADIALSEQTKTEGYGKNGTFSEKIIFNPITKWYTYDKLNFSTVENGDFNQNFSKIYGTRYINPTQNLLRGTATPVLNTGNAAANQRIGIYYFDNGKTFAEQGFIVGNKLSVSFDYSVTNPTSGNFSIQFNDTPWVISGAGKTITSANATGHVYTSLDITSSNISGIATGVELRFDNVPTNSTVTISNLVIAVSNNEVSWRGSRSETSGYVYSSLPSYTYFGESNVQRFSKWNIDKDIFSFVATIVPSNPAPSNLKFGLRFLDKDFNEYTAIVLEMETTPTNIQFNTDVNDEYYNAVIGSNTINQFANLDFGRFRTRQFQEGTMELIGVSAVEMSVKRKVDFI